MSPHGKRAGGQAQGQPRPPPSTLRAPDRGACVPRAPRAPGAPLSAAARGPAGTLLRVSPGCPSAYLHPTSASPALKYTGRRALRSLPCPPQSRGSRVASPSAATLHNCGGDACPAAAPGVTLHVAGARPQGRRLRAPHPRGRDAACPPGWATAPPARSWGGAVGGLRPERKGRERLGQTVHHTETLPFIPSTHICEPPTLCQALCPLLELRWGLQ